MAVKVPIAVTVTVALAEAVFAAKSCLTVSHKLLNTRSQVCSLVWTIGAALQVAMVTSLNRTDDIGVSMAGCAWQTCVVCSINPDWSEVLS